MKDLQSLLIEIDGLKSVYRKSYISDGSRNENSAEHSWHLALALMSLKPHLPKELNIDHAIKLALAHDICEIGAGDVSAYAADRTNQAEKEEAYLNSLAKRYPAFGSDILALWVEYESQVSLESHWVKLLDKLLPFLLNLANEGRTWQEQGITAPMVREHNRFIDTVAPNIYQWMMRELDDAVKKGWTTSNRIMPELNLSRLFSGVMIEHIAEI
ncbi:HD domain-containing protein [Veronia nyctiphanis]|nr:HD domain-containing protein [Veronia nyctiphanis]